MNERAGQELSAEARQLIAAARAADDPTSEDEARVKARWLAGIAAGAGVSSLSEAVRAAASTGWSWGMKAAMLAGAAAIAAVGVYLGWPDGESPEPRPPGANAPTAPVAAGARQAASPEMEAPAEQRAIVPVPPPAAPGAAEPRPQAEPALPTPGEPAPAQEPTAAEAPEPDTASSVPAPAVAPAVAAVEQAAQPPAAARPTRAAARAKPSSKSSSRKSASPEATAKVAGEAPAATATGQLGEEIARLSEVRGQLQSGSPARALELLSDYRSRFAQPNLAMEAEALQVDALCKAGKREAAREAATVFASRWPGSPLQQRVGSACQ